MASSTPAILTPPAVLCPASSIQVGDFVPSTKHGWAWCEVMAATIDPDFQGSDAVTLVLAHAQHRDKVMVKPDRVVAVRTGAVKGPAATFNAMARAHLVSSWPTMKLRLDTYRNGRVTLNWSNGPTLEAVEATMADLPLAAFSVSGAVKLDMVQWVSRRHVLAEALVALSDVSAYATMMNRELLNAPAIASSDIPPAAYDTAVVLDAIVAERAPGDLKFWLVDQSSFGFGKSRFVSPSRGFGDAVDASLNLALELGSHTLARLACVDASDLDPCNRWATPLATT